nr:hypothetical protein [Lachnospiraceae bacterium]
MSIKRKIMGIVILLSAVLLLAACGKEETKSSKKRDKSTKSTVSTDTSASASGSSSSSKTGASDTKDGVKVIVTFQKEDGKTVEEERSFSEDMDFLTTEGPVWTLDLCGNEITLS